ncbi:MAG TPA: dihydrolipoyl dehydrogenase, partial [Candidatus Latescibacteria bacterium]|nr:dihydrolipoyl dehydrogenase [Candidatus Latescibacterota bacterium]
MAQTQVAVIGGGPGGYVAAFHAADLGLKVTLIDTDVNPGGVCLYRGCIPSKALLHVAALINEADHAAAWGVTFARPTVELDKLRAWKQSVVQKLTGGLGELVKRRKITHIQGRARFAGPTTLRVDKTSGGTEEVTFEYAILATGSRPTSIPTLSIPSPRVLDSTGALELADVPESLLVVGGGYIGLELGTVYQALGSRVSVVEMTPGLLPGADRDLVGPLARRIEKKFEKVMLETTVTSLSEEGDGIRARFKDKTGAESDALFGKVLIAVGRRPNSADLGLETTKVVVNARGFVEVDAQRRTAEPTIFAIGDVAGEPMLAHKASHEGMVAADVIAGGKSVFEPYAIPAVVFTDPEIAWCGLTETQAAKEGREIKVARFPWAASGRATTLDRNDGVTKVIVDPKTERVLGVGMTGAGAGELIAEGTLAVEMSALASDLKLTIHPHPTLSETLMEAADVYFGQSPHLWAPKRG